MAALVKYKYLGMSSVVEVDYPTPQVKLDLWGQTPGTYTGLDRFGRVINHPWINYGTAPEEDVARIQHGYDRNSNRLWRQNDVARALSKKFDQQYTYDGLNRLTDAKTGLLNGSHVIPPGSDTTFEQEWSLDYVGNWSCFKQDDDGDGTFDLEQTRTANPVNEITNIGATTGPTWTTPQYDPAGNTTSFPKPADPTESFTAVYDAWNRMVRVIDNETDDIVQDNVYDGRNFRIVNKTYEEGVIDETRHIYYTSAWQAIEDRLGSSPDSADPAQQYVWGIRYIDDLVLRDRDTSEPADGVLNERLYYTNDTQFNVIALVNAAGAAVERCEYDVYGTPVFLGATFNSVSGDLSSYDNEYLYTGRPLDAETRLFLFRNRQYNYVLGTFTVRDAMGYADGSSLYAGYFGMWGGTDPYGLESKAEWQAIVLRKIKVTDTELKGYNHWNKRNEQIMISIYGYYASAFAANPDLYWAGLAKLAGNLVYNGIQSAVTARFFVPGIGAELAGKAIVREMMLMNLEIFMDMAWQHEAYLQKGIGEIEERFQSGDVDTWDNYRAWCLIDAGTKEGMEWLVQEGNKLFLRREQQETLARGYKELAKIGITGPIGMMTTSPLPGGSAFWSVVPGGDITDFNDRWKWITSDMLPKWHDMSKANKQKAVELPLGAPISEIESATSGWAEYFLSQ